MRRALTLTLLLAALAPAVSADLAPGLPGKLLAKGQPISLKKLKAMALRSRFVYVGEEHGTKSHHLMQARMLETIGRAGPAALGVEYFPRSLQPILDRFNRCEFGIDQLPKEIDWKKTWGHPWKTYRPLFAAARIYRVPVYALNAERALVKKVRRKGILALERSELLALPAIDLDVESHKKRVRIQLIKAHPLPEKWLARFYQAFTVWDETMADSVCNILLKDRRPGLRILVVAGRAHIETGTGIPDRVRRRAPGRRLVIVCSGQGGGAELGDVVYASGKKRRPKLY